MTMYCFDVDGTLLSGEMKDEGEYVRGIIPTTELKKLEAKGNIICIVSPSPFLPAEYTDDKHWFNRNGSNDYRWENINDAMKAHDIPKESVVYVDDLESNRKQIEEWGVISYSPKEFMNVILKRCEHNIPHGNECTPCLTRSDLLLD